MAGIVFTLYSYYEFRGMLEIALSDKSMLSRIDYLWYLENHTSTVVTWFFIGFVVTMTLIWTVKTYFNKKKED